MEKKDTEKEEERHRESMLITHFHWYSTSLTSVPINSKYNSKKQKKKTYICSTIKSVRQILFNLYDDNKTI